MKWYNDYEQTIPKNEWPVNTNNRLKELIYIKKPKTEKEECIFCKCNGCDFCDDYRKPCNYCYQGNEQIGSCLKANKGGAK